MFAICFQAFRPEKPWSFPFETSLSLGLQTCWLQDFKIFKSNSKVSFKFVFTSRVAIELATIVRPPWQCRMQLWLDPPYLHTSHAGIQLSVQLPCPGKSG